MADKAPPAAFLRAYRSDGTIYSICRRCQLTIASKPNEVDLRKPEDAHVCSSLSFRAFFSPEELKDWED